MRVEQPRPRGQHVPPTGALVPLGESSNAVFGYNLAHARDVTRPKRKPALVT